MRKLYIKIAKAEDEENIDKMGLRDLQRSASLITLDDAIAVFEQNKQAIFEGKFEGELLAKIPKNEEFLAMRKEAYPFFGERNDSIKSENIVHNIQEMLKYYIELAMQGEEQTPSLLGQKFLRFYYRNWKRAKTPYEKIIAALSYISAMTDSEILAKYAILKSEQNILKMDVVTDS
jgi:hypothetical protein